MTREELKKEVLGIVAENKHRNSLIYAPFNPITGEGSILFKDRVRFNIPELRYAWFIPERCMKIPLFQEVKKCGSVEKFVRKEVEAGRMEVDLDDPDDIEETCDDIVGELCRLRSRYDFAFWAAFYVYIKQKGGGEDILFRLNRPQRRLVERLEKKRLAGKPIRLVLLKARQWGGSTCIQIYMAWLQMVHRVGLNSLIVAHQGTASDEIQDMFDRMVKEYPLAMLHRLGEEYNEKEPKFVGVGHSGSIHRVPQRNCKIKIGTAERPDSARGGDYNLVHCSEVGLWKKTEGKTPEQIVRSACSGVLLKPYTMIVYESTANGTGNFFQREYDAAKRGQSQFDAMFIAWYEIEQYSLPIEGKLYDFAKWLYINRENTNAMSNREESGQYLWWLWTQGATLEAINWYIQERKKYTDHGDMAAEYPSDDVEAFVHSGEMVFDKYKVEKFRADCRTPRYIGDVYGKAAEGKEALQDVKFVEDHQGRFWAWELPEIDPDEKVTDRYLTVVDIGGRSRKADWSVITVFDRMYMMDNELPVVVAQWYGHIDMDLLAWKSAMIGAYYDNSLLVIESNTLETHDKDRSVDGDQGSAILGQIRDYYDNLYYRVRPAENSNEEPTEMLGFHTNVKTKPEIITTLVKVIREKLYIERDERVLDEYLTYERKQNGAFGAVTGKHDDLLMTRAIGLHLCYNYMERPKVVKRFKPGEMKVRHKKAISAATV